MMPPTIVSAKNSSEPSVNILTWIDTLNNPAIISAAEKKCGVKISYDEYYTNDEFLRRWETQKKYYDAIIFDDAIYNLVNIPHFSDNTLWRQSLRYHPTVRAHYQKAKYPHNIAYFMNWTHVFLWSSHNMSISSKDTVSSIFDKTNKVAIMLNPIAMTKLIKESSGKLTLLNKSLDKQHLDKSSTYKDIYFSNEPTQIKKKDFSFIYGWVGNLIPNLMQDHKDYTFLIHPKLSPVRSYLITQVKNTEHCSCVVNFLTQKKIASSLQKNTFYFSPYVDSSNIENPFFKEIYKNYIKSLPRLPWMNHLTENDFYKINKSKQTIKIIFYN